MFWWVNILRNGNVMQLPPGMSVILTPSTPIPGQAIVMHILALLISVLQTSGS